MSGKNWLLIILLLPALCLGQGLFRGQQDLKMRAASDIGDNLDLYAVSDLFMESPTLEDFEMELNNPETGINNLDLDEDGYTDYIRVTEEVYDDTHLIGLEALLYEDENQRIAVIEINKNTDDDDYILQVTGDEQLYGNDYTLAPESTTIRALPIVVLITTPRYRLYRSKYYHGHYPIFWKPWRPAPTRVYHSKMHRMSRDRVHSIHRRPHMRVNQAQKDARMKRAERDARHREQVKRDSREERNERMKRSERNARRDNAPIKKDKRVKRSTREQADRRDIRKRTAPREGKIRKASKSDKDKKTKRGLKSRMKPAEGKIKKASKSDNKDENNRKQKVKRPSQRRQ